LLPADELAVKAGRRRLTYRGPETAIENIAMVVSGLGIAPALQLLKQLLSEPALQVIEIYDYIQIQKRRTVTVSFITLYICKGGVAAAAPSGHGL
jgi:hypothetical protein